MESLNNRVKSYFKPGENWECYICNKIYKGTVANLKEHLASSHYEIADSLGIKKREKGPKRNSTDLSTQNIAPKYIKVMVNPNELIRECICSMLKHNISLNAADSFGREKFLGQFLKPFNLSLNRNNVKKFIIDGSNQINKLIEDETKNIYPSLVFDSASRHGRHVLAAGIRYVKENKIFERTIGIITEKDQQLGEVISQQLIELLGKIEKNVNDIYSCCTDQGRNMVKASKLLIAAQQEIQLISFLEDTPADELELLFNDEDDEDEEDNSLEDIDDTNEIFESVGSFASKIACMAHVCQLGAKKVSMQFDKTKLKDIRDVAIASKRVLYNKYYENISKPISDINPRWDSSYLMITRFHTFKEQYKRIPIEDLVLSSETWRFIDEYEKYFAPVHAAMLYFQRKDITLSIKKN